MTMHEEEITDFFVEENETDVTVFDEAISLLNRLERNIMSEINDSIFSEIKSMSRPYCNEKYS